MKVFSTFCGFIMILFPHKSEKRKVDEKSANKE